MLHLSLCSLAPLDVQLSQMQFRTSISAQIQEMQCSAILPGLWKLFKVEMISMGKPKLAHLAYLTHQNTNIVLLWPTPLYGHGSPNKI